MAPNQPNEDITVTLWGVVVALNCVCKNYASLLALRIVLGIFESCVSPR